MNTWNIVQNKLSEVKNVLSEETKYTVGNGFMNIRGSDEEGYPGQEPAMLVRGIVGPSLLGHEELINCPAIFDVVVLINGERLVLSPETVVDYQKTLNMREGLVYRTLRWRSSDGVVVRVESERFCSLASIHHAAQCYQITIEEASTPVKIEHRFVTAAAQGTPTLHWQTIAQGHRFDLLWLLGKVRGFGDRLTITTSCTLNSPSFQHVIVNSDIAPYHLVTGMLTKGEIITVEKVVTVYTSLETPSPLEEALKAHRGDSYQKLKGEHVSAWEAYWDKADILIEGDVHAQQCIRYCLYQLRSSAPPDDLYSIAAKGLSGPGYKGHIFHDTEIYMLPFFDYVLPEVARDLLLYRYRLLHQARAKAQEGGYDGAQYPWESGAGRDPKNPSGECTPRLIANPEGEIFIVHNGEKEIHISSNIAYAILQYWKVTGDYAFMHDYGAEMLLSIALFWASRVEWKSQTGRYEITGVIGPDEWHEGVNDQGEGVTNNAYTNYMARYTIKNAITTLAWLEKMDWAKAAQLKKLLNLTPAKRKELVNVVQKLYCPFDPQTELIEQFEGFFQLKKVDVAQYASRTKALRDVLGGAQTQRSQVLKQADVLALLVLQREDFDKAVIKANWDYYYPITDHIFGSSLSRALHAILSCELGLVEEAYTAFMAGAETDLFKRCDDGWHMANSGSSWQAVVFGFAGLRIGPNGEVVTHPCLPSHWTRLAFKVNVHGEWRYVDLTQEGNDQD